jgi:hypothetical protein
VWSQGSQQPMFPAIAGHAGDNPSTSNHQVGGKKGQVKIPCWLCGEMHHTYLFPHMDEASQLLEDIVISQQQPPVASHEPSPNQPLVDEVVGLIPSSVDPLSPWRVKLIKWLVQYNPRSIPLFPWRVKWIPLRSFLSLHIPPDKGAFHPFQWNPLQILRSFPLIGIV